MKRLVLLLALFAFNFIRAVEFSTHDYVIVGAGGGGSVFVNRLSEDSTASVLALERGEDTGCYECNVINSLPNLLGEAKHGNTFTTTQFPIQRVIRESSFRGSGGSTAVWGGLALPSSRYVFDNFYPEGFRYSDLLPYFKKLEDHYCNYLSEEQTGISAEKCAELHGKDGPMDITEPSIPATNNITKALITGIAELGLPFLSDLTDPEQQREGLFWIQFFRRKENKTDTLSIRSRENAWTGYVEPITSRSNLEISYNSLVQRLIILAPSPSLPKRIVGVEYVKNGVVRRAYARKRVILSAGDFETPKLLQLSGIGPAETLEKLDIPVVQDHPFVGRNIQNHIGQVITYKTRDPNPDDPLRNSREDLILFLKSPFSAPDVPYDIHVYISNNALVTTLEPLLDGIPVEYLTPDFQPNNLLYFLITYVSPTTNGTLDIQTKDAWEQPLIDYNWNGETLSPASAPFLATVWARQTLAFLSFNTTWGRTYLEQELYPAQTNFGNPYFSFLYDTSSYYHHVGSCALGKVVGTDSKLMGGFEGLSICDNSILPYLPDGNPSKTMFAVCEKMADIVKSQEADQSGFTIQILSTSTWNSNGNDFYQLNVLLRNDGTHTLPNVNIVPNDLQLQTVWGFTQDNAVLSFPSWIVNAGGLAPGGTVAAGVIVQGKYMGEDFPYFYVFE